MVKVISDSLACFDGAIEPSIERELLTWAQRKSSAGTKTIVVRSRGGDAQLALSIAEELQRQHAHVVAYQICASSCANYLFAGVRKRSALGPTAVLFHGGFSPKMKQSALEMFDLTANSPAGKLLSNPQENRRQIEQNLLQNQARQTRLFVAAGVSERIVSGVEAINISSIDARECAGRLDNASKFVFFGEAQKMAFGLNVISGKIIDSPGEMSRHFQSMAIDPRACRFPA